MKNPKFIVPNSIKKQPERESKISQDEWLSCRCIWGYNAMWNILLGGRERGKSYDVMDMFLRQWKKTNGTRVFYWLRITDTEQKSLLNNNAVKLIDPDLYRKYFQKNGEELLTNADCVYSIKRDKDRKIIKGSKKLICHVLSLAGSGNAKGNGFFDNEYLKNNKDAWYNICLDEFNIDKKAGQKNLYDVVYTLATQLENLIRSTKERVRIVCIANNTQTCSDLLSTFEFIPQKPGIYHLKKKKCVIWMIPNNEAYVKRREGTALNILLGDDDSNITNEVDLDVSLIDKRKTSKAIAIIKFYKSTKFWFTLWNNNIISEYKGETIREICMRRYIGGMYMEEVKNNIVELMDARALRFKNITTYIKFENEIMKVKPQVK